VVNHPFGSAVVGQRPLETPKPNTHKLASDSSSAFASRDPPETPASAKTLPSAGREGRRERRRGRAGRLVEAWRAEAPLVVRTFRAPCWRAMAMGGPVRFLSRLGVGGVAFSANASTARRSAVSHQMIDGPVWLDVSSASSSVSKG